jgi:hypothetical protein
MRDVVDRYEVTAARFGRFRWGGNVEAHFAPDPASPFKQWPWRLQPLFGSVFSLSIPGCEFSARTERGLRRLMRREIDRDRRMREDRRRAETARVEVVE